MEKFAHLFTLKIRGLGLGSHTLEFSVPASKLDIPMFHGNVNAKGKITISDRLALHLHLEATGTFICDRCAVEFERTFTPDLDLLYVPPELANDLEDDDNVHIFDSHTSEIDFTEDVRDAILLSIPMKNLHSPDCNGVDLGGSEIVIDERLAGLGGLLQRLQEEEMNSKAPGGVSQG